MADDLFSSAQIGRTATRAELMALDAIIGPLPPSYRDFAETYGDGLTNALILVFMPFDGGAGEFVSESGGLKDLLDEFMAERLADGDLPGDEDCLQPYDEESRGVAIKYREFVFFARSENGETFVWLEMEGTFSFYSLDKAFLSLRYCGDSLLEMISRLQTSQIKLMLGTGYGPLPSTFIGMDRSRKYVSTVPPFSMT